ncbi:hypothetical protein [Bifidobacterium jacchi]|nr:hypothetical protein [Bifidobacterium jacchi]
MPTYMMSMIVAVLTMMQLGVLCGVLGLGLGMSAGLFLPYELLPRILT